MKVDYSAALREAEKAILRGDYDLSVLRTAERAGELALSAGGYFRELLRDDCFRIFVIGSTNSGKSAFVNSLIGENLMPVSSRSCTAIAYRVEKSEKKSLTFGAFAAGRVTVSEEGEVVCDRDSDLTDLLFRFLSGRKEEGKAETLFRDAIAFLNGLPKTREEAEAAGTDDYISDSEIVVRYPVRLELPVDSFVINDTPGHTDSANGGSHFEKLCEAVRGDTANTVLLFVLRPDNPSTTDNAELVDKICEINRAIDPAYSFFIVSHADSVAQNPFSLSEGKPLSREERMGEFDELVEKNTVKAKSCVIRFGERNVFFVDSYKSLLSFSFPELLSAEGYMPYEYERDEKGFPVLSDRVLPYYRKNRVATEGISAEKIVGECEKILESDRSPLEKSLVRSGLYSVRAALSEYVLLKKDEMKAGKLRRGVSGRLREVSAWLKEEKEKALCRMEKNAEKKKETEERLLRVVKDKLDAVRFEFDRGFFASLEEEVGERCLDVLSRAVSEFHGIGKEQFTELYNACHPKANLISLKGMNKRSIEVFKEEVKTEIVEKKLNDLYLDAVIGGFFDNPRFGEGVTAQKAKILSGCYEKLAADDRLTGIGKPDVSVTREIAGDVRGFALENLRKREVSLRWRDFTGAEKFRNFIVGIFRPSGKKVITQKLEVDVEMQKEALAANWKAIEDALSEAVEKSFSENELASFRALASGEPCLSSVDGIAKLGEETEKDRSYAEALTEDEKRVEEMTDSFLSLFPSGNGQ
ncbi:MAG: dynamin family protein [Candidatus Borkfalkiaceae bacterium]|nr:dynamin family protein [Christensenellaceae bacterium]